MDSAALLLAVAMAGVNFGWQPAEDGKSGFEYVVQIEPELIDALNDGEPVPIESHVPPEVAPIRKIRIVVGRGEVPRTPIRHTANFAGQQSGWSPDRYTTAPAASGTYDRYAAPPPSAAPQSSNAVSNAGSALTGQVQTGLQSAGQQLSRTGQHALDSAQDATQQFGTQLQQWADGAARQLQSTGNNLRAAAEQTYGATGNSFRQSGSNAAPAGSNPPPAVSAGGVSAPPWPTATTTDNAADRSLEAIAPRDAIDTTAPPGMSITRTPGGWTSIGSNVAAPPLVNPPLSTGAGTDSTLRMAAAPGASTSTGSSLPPPPAGAGRQPLHSPLVDPSGGAANGTGGADWGSAWGAASASTPATIGRSGDAPQLGDPRSNSGLVPIPPRYPTQTDPQQASNRWSDPWAEDDPWNSPQQPQSSTAPPAAAVSTNAGQMPSGGSWPAAGQHAAPAEANGTAMPPLITQAPGAGNTPGQGAPSGQPLGAGAAPTAGGNFAANHGSPAEQPPWIPLLVVSLSLVGSLSANLFLGWSYMDARQKYRTLVRKTADTFRRAAGAAAA